MTDLVARDEATTQLTHTRDRVLDVVISVYNDRPCDDDPSAHLNNSGLIQQCVERNLKPITVGGVRLYDLTT
jgi:hypothetical protein